MNTNPQENPVSVRFRSNNKERLRKLCDQEDRSFNYLINKAVEEFLIRRGL